VNPIVRVLAIAALLLAAACAELPRAPAGGFEFELTGRFAARYRDEAASGLIAWRHHALRDEVLLSSPFGQGMAQITRDGEAVTLVSGDKQRYVAADAEQLTEQVLGFRLPLRGLADWVRARPSGDAPAQAQRAPDGRLQVLEQRGWRIEYTAYEGAQPKVLKLNYPGLELRLAIREWK
jgi:outer membrane lipoprotein LolB